MAGSDTPNTTVLADEKRELLALLLEEQGIALRQRRAIIRRPSSETAPLSFAQQRIWILNQLGSGTHYTEHFYLLLTGPLDLRLLERSYSEIIRRHNAIRTRCDEKNGVLVQTVLSAREQKLPSIDLSAWPETEREGEARRRIDAFIQKPVDIAIGLHWEAAVLRLCDTRHYLLVNMHHIATDSWSCSIFARELTALYEAFSQGRPSPLPELPIQYADYAVWQRQWLTGDTLSAEVAFWKRHLADAPLLTELPLDRPRPKTQSFNGAKEAVQISPKMTEELRALSAREGCTLFITLLTVFKCLLARYSGQSDVIVGTPVGNRNRPELEGLVGFFVNTLPLRTSVNGDPTFRELLQRVKQTALGGFDHAELPFERMVEELRPERDPAFNPLCQVMFVLQNQPYPVLHFAGVTGTHLEVESTVSKLDLTLGLTDTADGIAGWFEYATDIFEAATIQRMAGHLVKLLEAALANPDQRLSQLPLLTEPERQQLLVDWNYNAPLTPPAGCIHQLVELQVDRTPEATAAVCGEKQLTYRELDQRANQLAHHLRGLGVGPETLVAISADRSLETLIGILGILKAGGAYVPLDPAYPAERLAETLAAADPLVLLTKQDLRPSFPACKARTVCLDTDGERIGRAPSERPANVAAASNLAYVIFTSGSTGQPKGVQITHDNVVHSTCARQTRYSEPPSSYLLLPSFAFDSSVAGLFWTLSHGGVLHVPPEKTQWDPLALQELIARHQIAYLDSVPTFYSLMLSECDLRKLACLRVVIVAGETCPRELVLNHFRVLPNTQLFNEYGPTEGTVWCTADRCQPETSRALVPIGRVIPAAEIYLVDAHLQPVPIGIAGELLLGGRCLSRGYLRRPDLTAEKFIRHPFSSDPNARLYRTGDLCRYLPDGNLEYVGRIDHQVKIRGFRVELEEIEATLSRHSAVRENVVVAREDTPGQKRLVAYVALRAGAHGVTVSSLRLYLKSKLPEYMLPAAFVLMEALPLNPNGKVDRRQLPPPPLERPELETTFVAPTTATQITVAQVWTEVLGIAPGLHDNFFELGGHSLLGTQVMSRLRERLQVDLPLRRLFETPTVEELADAFDQARVEAHEETSRADTSVEATDALLSPAQQRIWFFNELQPGLFIYNVPLNLKLTGQLNTVALEQALSDILGRHDVLRARFPAAGGRPMQAIAAPSAVKLPVLDLRGYPEAERGGMLRKIEAAEATQQFDLAAGPLFKARLVRLADNEHRLLMTIHHIVFDGWSAGVLLKELAQLYASRAAGRPLALPPLPMRYADYAKAQAKWLAGKSFQQELAYWRRQLGGRLPALELPCDRPRPPVQSFAGARYRFTLPSELYEQIRALCRRNNATLFMALVAIFKTFLCRYTGQTDIVIGTPSANRTRKEIEGLIGFFVNSLVLRTDLAGNPSFSDVLKRVREVALNAYGRQEVPFEELVKELQPQRDLTRNPLFQTMFALQNASEDEVVSAGVKLEILPIEDALAKFDLTCFFFEKRDRLNAMFEYCTDLFDEATIVRMAGHLEQLMRSVLAQPDARIAQLPFITEPERRQILVEWNRTEHAYPNERTVTQLFEQQAAATPQQLAVVGSFPSPLAGEGRRERSERGVRGSAESLTYAQLNARANQLAHYLRQAGMRANTLAAVCMDRSPAMAMALLGILKAGGAYLPLDPAHPRERLTQMLADARPLLAITERALKDKFAYESVLCLDESGPLLAESPSDNPAPLSGPSDLAYVIYTSGSTGTPKGVQIEHAGLSNLIHWHCATYQVGAADRATQLAGPAFDASVWELWPHLCAGATIYFPSDAVRLSPRDLLLWMARNKITLAFLPTPLAEAVLFEQPPADLALRAVYTGGDKLHSRPQPHHRFKLFNHYGPTENTVLTTWTEVEPSPPASGTPHIGRPAHNHLVYVLDANQQPVPVGVAGELYVGGAGLARGYLNRPELTAEKFVPNPFSPERSARLYRTGDLVRWLPGGNIDFLGRIDHQVKIRGFRIELGEIEAVLRQHPVVRDAVVVAREDTPGEKRLAGYFVPAAPGYNIKEMRAYLRAKLPEYMVPLLTPLDGLPLTHNGKVDRAALPAPADFSSGLRPAVMFKTGAETAVAEIWAEALGRPRLAAGDNFWARGGTLAAALRVNARVREKLGHRAALRHLFAAPTLSAFAAAVQRPPELPARREPAAAASEPLRLLDSAVLRGSIARTTQPPTRLSRIVVEQMQRMVEKLNVPSDVLLLSAFAAALRNCGQSDALHLGLSLSEQATLALRIGLSGGPTFRELIARVRESLLAADEQGASAPAADKPAIVFALHRPAETRPSEEFRLCVWPESEGLAATVFYPAGALKDDVAAAILGDFAAAVEMMLSNPDGRLSKPKQVSSTTIVDDFNQPFEE